jgi:hypothetical protein
MNHKDCPACGTTVTETCRICTRCEVCCTCEEEIMSQQAEQKAASVVSIDSKTQRAGAHFTITAQLEGFPITIELEGKASDLKQIIDRLKAIGAQPPALSKPAAAATSTTDAPPKCNLHSRPMKPSKKPGAWICTARLADGSYCKEQFDPSA